MDENPSTGTPSTYSSSITGTSNSKSATSLDEDKATDLTKDNAASPIDLECNIQAERITKIINEAVYKCKLAICLPDLVADKTLSKMLSINDMDDLMYIYEKYESPLAVVDSMNMDIKANLNNGDFNPKDHLNPELGHLMHILNKYPDLKPTVEDMFEQKRLKQFEDKEKSQKFLDEMQLFRKQMIEQMATTAAEELLAKINTRKLEHSNNRYLASIAEYSTTMREERETFENLMATKQNIITKLNHELSLRKYEAMLKLKKKILDSERQMVLATRAHVIKHELLKEEEAESIENYESMLKRHLKEEKNQRGRRFKVETQLLSWLQKYDVEMYEKQVELDEFTKKYDEEFEKCEELQKKLDIQDVKYLSLMEEREIEYHQEMTEKMKKFMVEHAARVIQHAWRTVLVNRAEKKKLKKLKKKMDIEREKLEVKQAAIARAAEKAAKLAEKRAKEEQKAADKVAKAAAKAEKEAAAVAEKEAAKGKK